MELPDPFLPGAVSLLDQLDKKLVVVLRDGKTLVGYLRTLDQFANLVLHETLERIHVDEFYGDIPRGIFLIRGENVVLAGEMDDTKPNPFKKVSMEEILRLQAEKVEQRQKQQRTRQELMHGSGQQQAKNTIGIFTRFPVHRLTALLFSPALTAPLVRQIAKISATLRQTVPTQQQNSRGTMSMFKVIFVLGPPGSGKGTQCQRIEQHFGFVHLSAGDLLREERQREGSTFGELIDRHIREGSIVPVEITCKLLENAMVARSDTAAGFLVDGFPRNKDNFDGWQREMGTKAKVLFVLSIQAPIEICVQRCLNRGQGRTDDNEESIRKRIVTYNQQTVPIIDHYASLSLVKTVDSTKGPDLVFAEIRAVFEQSGIGNASEERATPNAKPSKTD
ncbi:hypothetical protein niasHT_024978 [Heterodera trifolii]|uniref:UMP-CMP kinase n=1 Tax=Heterodera trifolii TaxID=157864 RepID=A0ABD2KSQ7_9BILA